MTTKGKHCGKYACGKKTTADACAGPQNKSTQLTLLCRMCCLLLDPPLDDNMEGLPIALDVRSAEVSSKGQKKMSDGRNLRPLFVDVCCGKTNSGTGISFWPSLRHAPFFFARENGKLIAEITNAWFRL